jgi:TRAP-type C4-dicarboxylate transport system permease small subunit
MSAKATERIVAPSLLARFDALLTYLDRAAAGVVIVLMAILTVVVVVQVVLRYGFNSSLDWGAEVPRLCFISMVFIAIPIGFKRGLHVGVDLLTNQLPRPWQRLLLRGGAAIMVALLVVIAVYAARVAHDTWDQRIPALDISTGIFYVILIVCSVHAILHLIRVGWTGAAPQPESLSE